jgi:hypothetical protein
LISILMVASRLGLLLFSQPARWVFSWDDEEPGSNQDNQFGIKRRTLMVSPGLKERITARAKPGRGDGDCTGARTNARKTRPRAPISIHWPLCHVHAEHHTDRRCAP